MNRAMFKKRHAYSYTLYRPKRKKNKLLTGLFFILLSLILIFLFAVPPIFMNDMVNKHVNFNKMYYAKDFGLSSKVIKLTTSDGLGIVAQEIEIDNPNAMVIFLSGIHNPSVTEFFGHAKMLKENGYGSILLEMRAHGESEGDVIGLGYKEYLDTKAVVDYITEKYKDTPIIVYGLSMGGATAINSIGEIDEIDGLISMSAYSSWEDAFCDNMVNMGAPKIYTIIQKPFVKIYTTFKYGLKSFFISPKNEIKKLGDRPALIIHSTDDTQVPFQSFNRIMKNAPVQVESWTVKGDNHFIIEDENVFLNPQEDKEYTEKILTFLNKNFNKDGVSPIATTLGINENNYPRIDGSTSTLPLVQEIYKTMFTPENNAWRDLPLSASKTVSSYEKLINNEVDMILVPSASQDILKKAQAAGVELEFTPISLEALIFITNIDNPTRNITEQQVRRIYLDYAIKNWKTLGGPYKEIIPICRNADSGSQAQLDNLILKGKPINSRINNNYIELTMDGLLDLVAYYPSTSNKDSYALGYTLYYYLQNMGEVTGIDKKLKVLDYEGIAATPETIENGSYPLSSKYYAVIRKDLPKEHTARTIINWLSSTSANECIRKSGLTPIRN